MSLNLVFDFKCATFGVHTPQTNYKSIKLNYIQLLHGCEKRPQKEIPLANTNYRVYMYIKNYIYFCVKFSKFTTSNSFESVFFSFENDEIAELARIEIFSIVACVDMYILRWDRAVGVDTRTLVENYFVFVAETSTSEKLLKKYIWPKIDWDDRWTNMNMNMEIERLRIIKW